MSHQLRITSGPKAGAVVALAPGQVVVIGRGAEAQLSIPEDNTLSRAHAEVANEGGQWILRNKSQHGTLLGGQVFNDQRPLTPGAEFQVGGTKVVFEAAGAGAPVGAGAPAGGGASAPAGGGAAGGGAAGGGAAGGGVDVAAGGAALAGGAAAAMNALPSGPVKIDGSAEGFPFGAIIKGGLGVMKANFMASMVLFSPLGIMMLLVIAMQVIARVLPDMMGIFGTIFSIFGLVVSLWSLALPMLAANYVAGVKKYQETGESFGMFSLIGFEGIVGRYIVQIVQGFAGCCFLLVPIFMFGLPIFIDKPELGFVGALKASLGFAKRNYVQCLILAFIIGFVFSIGYMLCGVGLMITAPACLASVYLAYECKRGEFEAVIAEDGITAG